MTRRILFFLLMTMVVSSVGASDLSTALVLEISVMERGSPNAARTAEVIYRVDGENDAWVRFEGLPALRIVPRIVSGDGLIELAFWTETADVSTEIQRSLVETNEQLRVELESPGHRVFAAVREVVELPADEIEERLAPVAQVETSPGMPEVIYDDEGTALPEGLEVVEMAPRLPSFVRADVATGPRGRVVEDLFLDSTRNHLQRWIEQSGEECQKPFEQAPLPFDDGQSRGNLVSAAETADWAVVARVTGRAPGFAGLSAGTLLRVQPEEVLSGDRGRTSEHFVFLEVGSFEVGGKTICTPGYLARDHAALPRVGERVLLFVGTRYANRASFIEAGPGDLVTIRPDGRVSLPEVYRQSNRELLGASIDEVSALVVRQAGESP